MAIKAEYKILVSYKGVLQQMSKREYLRLVREDATDLFIIGNVIPVNKIDIKWRHVEVKKKTIYTRRFTHDHAAQLFNLVNRSLPQLANKGAKNFLQNFNSLVINKMKKPFIVER
jgi:hypothetical protein